MSNISTEILDDSELKTRLTSLVHERIETFRTSLPRNSGYKFAGIRSPTKPLDFKFGPIIDLPDKRQSIVHFNFPCRVNLASTQQFLQDKCVDARCTGFVTFEVRDGSTEKLLETFTHRGFRVSVELSAISLVD